MLALGEALARRGHRIVVLAPPPLADRIAARGFTCADIGAHDYTDASLKEYTVELGIREGFDVVRYWHEQYERDSIILFRDGPNAIRQHGVDFLLIDQISSAGQAIAEHLALPFVTVCNAF
ncbi:MAG: hypothetical protein ACRCWJ_18710 [Casimicrobium sp.]